MAEAYTSLDLDIMAVDENIARELQEKEFMDNTTKKKHDRNSIREFGFNNNRNRQKVEQEDDDVMIIDNDTPTVNRQRQQKPQELIELDEVIAKQLQEELDLEYARKLQEEDRSKSRSTPDIGFRIQNDDSDSDFDSLFRMYDDFNSANISHQSRALPFVAPRFSTSNDRTTPNDRVRVINIQDGSSSSGGSSNNNSTNHNHHLQMSRPSVQARRRDPNNPRINSLVTNNSSGGSSTRNTNTHAHQPLFSNMFRIPLHMYQRHSRNPNSLLEFSDGDFTPEDYERLLQLDSQAKKSGLKKSEISNLNSFEYKAPSSDNSSSSGSSVDDNDKTCSICYDNFEAKEKLILLPCVHKFHKKCITPWLSEHRTCPLCKKDALTGQ